MPNIRPNKVQVPANPDAFSSLTTDLQTMADSIHHFIPVSSQAERDGLTKSVGLVVMRLDWPGVAEVCDGTTWWKLAGPQHAQYTASTAPPNNTVWGPGALTLDTANSINASLFSSPANSKLTVPPGVYNIFIRYVTDIATTGTYGQITNDGATVVYANMDQIDGRTKFEVPLLGFYASSTQNIQFTWQSATANANLASTVRIDRVD